MVTSKDIAKKANVSQSTVSRVLNHPEKVDQFTLEKVKKVMKEFNYRPNTIARSLVNKSTKTLVLISGPIHNQFFAETTTSIVNYANKRGYNTYVFFANEGNNMSIYESVLSIKTDGIILSSMFMDDPIYKELKLLDIPFIMFNRKHNKGGHFVEINNKKAGKIAAQHFVKLKHKNIGFIGGPLRVSTFYEAHKGFVDELKKQEINVDEHLICETDTSVKEVENTIQKMMSRKNKPTAIFTATDSIAFIAIDTLTQLGYNIADDISICGLDNVSMASHQVFNLTTIGQKTDKNLGRICVEYLINMIECESQIDKPVQITLDPVLYQRNTTKKYNYIN